MVEGTLAIFAAAVVVAGIRYFYSIEKVPQETKAKEKM